MSVLLCTAFAFAFAQSNLALKIVSAYTVLLDHAIQSNREDALSLRCGYRRPASGDKSSHRDISMEINKFHMRPGFTNLLTIMLSLSDMGSRLWSAGLRAVDTLAHCGLTSPMRQSLKLPGHHVGLGCPGVSGCSRRPEASLVSHLRDNFRTLGRVVCPSQALWTSAPRVVREYAAAGSRAGEIASSMPAMG